MGKNLYQRRYGLVWLGHIDSLVAVIVAVPIAKPRRLGCRVGCVWPALNETLDSVKVAFAGSLLASRIVIEDGAGAAKVTLNGMVFPGVIVTWAGITIPAEAFTVMLAVASVRFDEPTAALARITAVPAVTPVTGTTTLVALAGMVT